jgi:hypothetical protein
VLLISILLCPYINYSFLQLLLTSYQQKSSYILLQFSLLCLIIDKMDNLQNVQNHETEKSRRLTVI